MFQTFPFAFFLLCLFPNVPFSWVPVPAGVKKHRNLKIHNFVILKTKNHFDQIISKMHMFLFKEKLLNKLHIGFKYVFILVFLLNSSQTWVCPPRASYPRSCTKKGCWGKGKTNPLPIFWKPKVTACKVGHTKIPPFLPSSNCLSP